MEHLKYTKTQVKFIGRFNRIQSLRSYGRMQEVEAIRLARESVIPLQARSAFDPRFETAYINEHGELRVIAAGSHGHLIFGEHGELFVSMEYNETPVFKNRTELVIELIEHAFYEGKPLVGVIGMLDNQLFTPNQAFADIRWFNERHAQLVDVQKHLRDH